ELRFELLDGVGQARLRHVAMLRRPAEVLRLGEGEQVLELPKKHALRRVLISLGYQFGIFIGCMLSWDSSRLKQSWFGNAVRVLPMIGFVALALVSGLLIGCVGIGGVLLVPVLTLAGVDVHAAIAASMFSFIFSGLIGVWLYQRKGSIA